MPENKIKQKTKNPLQGTPKVLTTPQLKVTSRIKKRKQIKQQQNNPNNKKKPTPKKQKSCLGETGDLQSMGIHL